MNGQSVLVVNFNQDARVPMLLLDIDTSDSMQEGVAESDNLRDKMCVGHLTSSGFHCKDDPNLKPQAKSIFSGQSALIDSIEAHEA